MTRARTPARRVRLGVPTLLAAGLCAATLVVSGCAGRAPAPSAVPSARAAAFQKGIASWYGRPYHGRRTASGERYDMDEMTAAHPTLPFGTRVEVVNLDNGRSVVVRINDRGPFVDDRVIDLSRAAARRLDFVDSGTARVAIYLVD